MEGKRREGREAGSVRESEGGMKEEKSFGDASHMENINYCRWFSLIGDATSLSPRCCMAAERPDRKTF